jgi:hypothetical protein
MVRLPCSNFCHAYTPIMENRLHNARKFGAPFHRKFPVRCSAGISGENFK